MHIIAVIIHPEFTKSLNPSFHFLLMFIDNVYWWIDKILRILNILTLEEKEMRREMVKNCTRNWPGLCGEMEDQTKFRGYSPHGNKINVPSHPPGKGKEKRFTYCFFFFSCLKPKSNQIKTDQNKELRNEASKIGTGELWIYLNVEERLFFKVGIMVIEHNINIITFTM